MEKLTTLYRFYDENNLLLYVGITSFMPQRAKQHSKNSEWHRFADRAKLEHFETREKALEAEADAIRSEKPLYNLAGSDQYGVNSIEHFYELCEAKLTDPLHLETIKKINFFWDDCKTQSSPMDKLMWSYLNAMHELWDEDKIPCIACRTLVHDDYLLAAHGRVCLDYENELRGLSK